MVNIRSTLRQSDHLVQRVRTGKALPVLAASVIYDQIFAITGEQELARAWAEDLGFLRTWDSVCRVAQYHYDRTGDDVRVKSDFLLFLKRVLLGQAQNDPTVDRDIMEELIASIHQHTFTEIALTLGYPMLDDPQRDPLLLLAHLPVPIYVTTSFHGLLQPALRRAGKEPQTAVCGWNEAVRQSMRPEHRLDPGYFASVQTPLVLHIYGHEEYPESLVLTEDNYLSFLVSIAQNVGRDALDPIVPLTVLSAWVTSSHLYLGFAPAALEFKALWMGLSSSQRVRPKETFQWSRIPEQELIGQYIEQYLSSRGLDIYWGDTDEFLSHLYEAWNEKA